MNFMQINFSKDTELWFKEGIISIAILVGFWMLAIFVRYFFAKCVSIFTKHTETELDDKIVDAVKGPIFYIILLFGFSLSLDNLILPLKLKSIGEVIIYVFGVATAILMVYRVVNVILEWYTQSVSNKSESLLEKEFLPLIEKIIFIFIFFMGLIVVLRHFNYDVLSLITALGVTSLAIGLAAKDTLANMISGFTLMIDRPFRVGDRVKLATGEVGDVVEIGLRSTKIKTMDSNMLITPNTELMNTKVINQCYPNKVMRGQIKIGIAYRSDIEKAKDLMLDAARKNTLVVKEPGPIALFLEFGDFSLIIHLFFWIEDCFQMGIALDQINTEIKERFETEAIIIPNPSKLFF